MKEANDISVLGDECCGRDMGLCSTTNRERVDAKACPLTCLRAPVRRGQRTGCRIRWEGVALLWPGEEGAVFHYQS
jgi:hypothetical protein